MRMLRYLVVSTIYVHGNKFMVTILQYDMGIIFMKGW